MHPRSFIRILLAFAMVMGLFGTLLAPTAAQAADGDCYQVSGAGEDQVNGFYYQVGTHDGRPAYKHESRNFFISHGAIQPTEWNLTTAIGGGYDLYYASGASDFPPEGIWYVGFLSGPVASPGPHVKACNGDPEAKTSVFDLTSGVSLDGASGTMGIYTPASCYTGFATLTKVPPVLAPHYSQRNIQFQAPYLEVSISNTDGKTYENYCGLKYLYFNLSAETLKLWEAGELGVYKYNGFDWDAYPFYFVDAGEFGRVGFMVTGPGSYALGTER